VSSKDSTRQDAVDCPLLSCNPVPLFEVMAVRKTLPDEIAGARSTWSSSSLLLGGLPGRLGVAVDTAACFRGCSRREKEIAA
jgi:hypothetical protein